jgi:hypothetical protein
VARSQNLTATTKAYSIAPIEKRIYYQYSCHANGESSTVMSFEFFSRLRALSKILSVPYMSILFGFVLVPLREIIFGWGTRVEVWSWGWELNPYRAALQATA